MDILIAMTLIIIAAAMMLGKSLKIEIKHQYPDPPKEEHLKDPNKIDEDAAVSDAVADVLATLNDIMIGGDNNAQNIR